MGAVLRSPFRAVVWELAQAGIGIVAVAVAHWLLPTLPPFPYHLVQPLPTLLGHKVLVTPLLVPVLQ